jgi:hypothetical protein
MNGFVAGLTAAAAGFLAYLLISRKTHIRQSASDFSLFVTRPGSDGFCSGNVRKFRMRGRSFKWERRGEGCEPAPGSRFEIRLKGSHEPHPLVPAIPSGTNVITASVAPGIPPGSVYRYGLHQVLADGSSRQLEDPELEIGHI